MTRRRFAWVHNKRFLKLYCSQKEIPHRAVQSTEATTLVLCALKRERDRQPGERERVERKNRYNPRSVEIVLRFCLNFSSLLCLKRSAKSNGLQLITSVNNDEAALVQTMWVRRSECRSECSRYENVFTSIISLVTRSSTRSSPSPPPSGNELLMALRCGPSGHQR